MKISAVFLSALIPLAACVDYQPQVDTGMVMPSEDAESWGIAESAILFSDTALNGNETSTTTLHLVSSAVSDDELAAAPDLICDDAWDRVLARDLRSSTAAEALPEGTLVMTVTCGA